MDFENYYWDIGILRFRMFSFYGMFNVVYNEWIEEGIECFLVFMFYIVLLENCFLVKFIISLWEDRGSLFFDIFDEDRNIEIRCYYC